VIYAHTGGDIGASHSWRGASRYLQTRAQDRDYSQVDLAGNNAQVAFNGKSPSDRRLHLEIRAERQLPRTPTSNSRVSFSGAAEAEIYL